MSYRRAHRVQDLDTFLVENFYMPYLVPDGSRFDLSSGSVFASDTIMEDIAMNDKWAEMSMSRLHAIYPRFEDIYFATWINHPFVDFYMRSYFH